MFFFNDNIKIYFQVNPLYIILGLAAIVYLPTLVGVARLDVRIKTVTGIKVLDNQISLKAGLLISNNSSTDLRLNFINTDVFLNGTIIGRIEQSYNTPILANRQQVIPVEIYLTTQNLGQQLWQDAINRNLQNFVLEMQGNIGANRKRFSFNTTYTITDFVSGK